MRRTFSILLSAIVIAGGAVLFWFRSHHGEENRPAFLAFESSCRDYRLHNGRCPSTYEEAMSKASVADARVVREVVRGAKLQLMLKPEAQDLVIRYAGESVWGSFVIVRRLSGVDGEGNTKRRD